MQKNKISTYLFLLLCFVIIRVFTTTEASAQHRIEGVVLDASTRETLPGVNIQIFGTTRGTSTNIDGFFSLELEEDENILLFSFLGFQTLELEVNEQTNVTIQLQPIIGELDELVVIGYGAVRKRDVTGAISRVSASDIEKITTSNPEEALQGTVSGVQITKSSGAPGASTTVRIRGVGTFNNSSPIYVVDGVIIDDISFLNSSDIESFEVLKDASATAIYGSRGANGVILVQTKSGSGLTNKPVITITSEAGVQQLEKEIDLLNGREFATIANEIRPGSYNNVDAVPNTDWQDLIFQTAPIQNHQISVSGASDRGDYYFSIGYLQQGGIIESSEYERLSIKLNNSYKITPDFKIGNNITIAPYKQRVAPNATFAVYRAQPIVEPYYDDGSFAAVPNVGNPLADIEYSNNYNRGARIVGNIYTEGIVRDALLLKSSFGVDASYNKAENFTPAYTIYNSDGTASQQFNEFSDVFKGDSYSYTWLWENTINYIQDFGLHSINAVGGVTLQETRSEVLNLSGQNVIRDGEDFWYVLPAYVVDESNNINMVSAIYNGVNADQYYNMISFLGRVVYSYNDKYTTTLTLRRDGSSKFAEENRWGYFPSIGFGWNVDREAFMESVSLVDNLKIRGSWGKIGNEKISYYDQYSTVNSGLTAVFGSPDVAYVAATYGVSGNPDLKWETTTQTDIGLETGLLDNRLSVEFDYYNRVTDDILVDLSTPGHLGNGQGARVRYNTAEVLNRGVELTFDWAEKHGDFGYSINVNGSTVYNEVLEIGGNSGVDSVLIGGYLANGQSVTRTVVGGPIGAFYGYVTDGVFQNQVELDDYPHLSQADVGDLRFKDLNGDGVINDQDRTQIGSPIPDFIFGFTFNFDYRQFVLSLGFQGQYGNEIFNGKNVVRPDPYNFEQHVWDRWTGEGTSNAEPRASYGGYNYLVSDRFVHDGSYIRLRSLVLGYNLPQSLLDRLDIDRARFYIEATNLFTWTKYTGYTAEIGSGDVLSNGIDTGIYPIPRVISLGFNTTF